VEVGANLVLIHNARNSNGERTRSPVSFQHERDVHIDAATEPTAAERRKINRSRHPTPAEHTIVPMTRY
ncbi:hypothetical protein ACFROC_22805, partial [Nocardia tengchongensis]|uniref:hypothetical protein n=1 Tax=Nocardia tengchongensis TaxID=2055889 RepID=UPI00368B060D